MGGARMLAAVGVLVGLMAAGRAPGQGPTYTNMYGNTFNSPIAAQLNTTFWDSMASRRVYKMILRKHGYTDAQMERLSTQQLFDLTQKLPDDSGRPAKPAAPAAPSPVAATVPVRLPAPSAPATRFRATPGRLVLADMAKGLTKDAEAQKALLQVFEMGFKAYDEEAKKSGLVNDLAGSITFLIASAWVVYHDGQEPNADGLEILARGLQHALDNEAMRRSPAADKQRLHEALVALGSYLLFARQLADQNKDEASMASLKTAAHDALQGFLKLDPARLRITAAGLEIAK